MLDHVASTRGVVAVRALQQLVVAAGDTRRARLVRLVHVVHPLVGDECGLGACAIVAVRALERPLARVNTLWAVTGTSHTCTHT